MIKQEIHIMKTNKGHWLTEFFTPHEKHSHLVRKFLVRKKTQFQKAILADTYSFKRCLVLDGEMQSAELDEFIYHESLVHPSMVLLNGKVQNVLIMGGGEGATARELLKYNSIQKIVMVDIDGEVVDFAKKYLTTWHQGSFYHKKVEVVIDDAGKYVRQDTPDGKFDLIISDLPTPIEGGPAYSLYTIEFYKILKRKLSPNGIFAAQAGSGNLLQFKFHSAFYATLKKIFKNVLPYYAYVPSFDVPWAFLIATDIPSSKLNPTLSQINSILKKSLKKNDLKFYDGLTHQGLMAIPKFYRDILNSEKTVISEHRPVFFFK